MLSCPKPQLIPEPLLSITRVQFLFVAFYPGSIWRQAGSSALWAGISGGRKFRPLGRNFRGPEVPPLWAGISGGPEVPPLWAGTSGLSDRAPFRQGRGVNWLVTSSSSTPAPCTFSLRPGALAAGRPPPGRLRPGFRRFFAGFASPRRGDPFPPLTFRHGRR